jgi:hypothetical protein
MENKNQDRHRDKIKNDLIIKEKYQYTHNK